MINAFQMNTAGIETGFRLTGNAQSGGSQGECLFGILLNNLNSVQETGTAGSSGASLFTQAFLANITGSGSSASLITNSSVSPDGKAGTTDQAPVDSSDFLLPESSIPDLVSFLENKGFSSEEIDSIVLLSRNDEGFIQIQKLANAIKSAGAGALSAETGLGVEVALVPKVQELLFNMGMGVGEVRETIEKSKDETGVISLDKLTGALNEQQQGSLTKTDVALLLEDNNISVTSQKVDIAPAAVRPENIAGINAPASDIAAGISQQEKGAEGHQWLHEMTDAGSGQKNDAILNKDASIAEATASGLQRETNNEPQAHQANDTNRTALELKKEFMNFVDAKTKGSGEPETQKTAVRTGEESVQAREAISSKETPDPVNTVSRVTRSVYRESTQETSSLNQAFSKGQAQWQKGDQEKIIDILKGENQANARAEGRAIAGAQNETMKDPGGFLKQDDQKAGQEILSGGNENKQVPGGSTNETLDFKDSLLNIRETQAVDATSQNMSKITEDIASRTQTKGAYNLPEPMPKVFDRMIVMIKNGEQTGKLMIQPPELGKIDIDISIKNGHMQANLTTENIAVKEIIEANLNQLKQQLNDQGLVVEQFNVSVGSHNRQFREDFGQAGNSGYGSQDSGASETEEVTSATDAGTSQDIINSRYRIDVRV